MASDPYKYRHVRDRRIAELERELAEANEQVEALRESVRMLSDALVGLGFGIEESPDITHDVKGGYVTLAVPIANYELACRHEGFIDTQDSGEGDGIDD